MATKWERLDTTTNGPAFKAWLIDLTITEEDFEEFSYEKIHEWREKFNLAQGRQQHDAYDLKFSVICDQMQADGLRRLFTESAKKNSAFYATTDKTAQERHDDAFKSSEVPEGGNLAELKGEGDGEREYRFISVHLLFLSLEKANAFKGDVLAFLERRPSSRVYDIQANALSHTPEEGIQIQTATAPPLPSAVFEQHYRRREQPATQPDDSLDFCDLTSVASSLPPGCVGDFNTNDPLWPNHAVERQESFGLYAEKAHIFPHKECSKHEKKKDGRSRVKIMTGYEWLDDPSDAEFNFLYLSKDMHTSFDGTGHGRASKDAAQPAICIEPEARTVQDRSGVKRFEIETDAASMECRATIPLRVWCKSDDVARIVGRQLSEEAQLQRDDQIGLPYFSNISIKCVHRTCNAARCFP